MSVSISRVPDNDRSWSIEWYNQWPELWRARKQNWINFTPVGISFEYGNYKGRYIELTVFLLGLGFCWEWWDQLSRSVWLADMDQAHAEIIEELGIDSWGDDAVE